MSKIKQYRVLVKTKLIVTVDTNKTDIETVLQDMNYDFEPSPNEEHADIPSTEIMEWEIDPDYKTDTILV